MKPRWLLPQRGEWGYVLILTIIATLVGVLLVVPALSYVSAVLLGNMKSLDRAQAYLSRDAAVEYAIAVLKNDTAFRASLSSQPLTPVALPTLPVQTNDVSITSLTATLLTPSQWDLVMAPRENQELLVSLYPILSRTSAWNTEQRAGEEEERGGLRSEVILPSQEPVSALVSAPAVSLSKTASPTQVAPGEQVTYTIQLTNTGDATALTVNIVDTLPASSGFSYILGSTTGGITANPKVTAGGRVLTWESVPSIAPGGSLSFSFRVLAGSATGQFYNQVLADGSNYTDVSTGNTAPVLVGPKMRVAKTASPSVVPAGTNVTYTVSIFNDTAGTAATLTEVGDTLAAGFSYVSGSTTGAITANPQVTGQVNLKWTGTWTIAGGSSMTFSFQAAAALDWGTYYDTVTIKGTNFPDVTTGPTAGVTTVGWIQIVKTVDNPSPGPQETITYTIAVTNVGPSAVAITRFTDTIPTTFIYVPGSTSGAVSGDPSITGNTLTWSGAQIPASINVGAQLSFSFRTTVPSTSDTYYDEAKVYVSWLGNNYIVSTGNTAPVTVVTQARIVVSEVSGDTSGPPGWGNVNVTGYSFAPNKLVILYWVDLNNPLNPTTNPPAGTNLLPGQTIITLSSSYAPLSFSTVSITIPANANWGNGYVVAMMQKTTGVWVEQDRKPFNVRAKYEIASQTGDGVKLVARAAFTGRKSADGTYSTPSLVPVITVYQWREE